MDPSDFIKRPLSHEYVNDMMDKLSNTLEKYELVIPEMERILTEIIETEPEDMFGAVMVVIDALVHYKDASPLMGELFENVRQDFWHGVNADIPKHEGEFYINSVAD